MLRTPDKAEIANQLRVRDFNATFEAIEREKTILSEGSKTTEGVMTHKSMWSSFGSGIRPNFTVRQASNKALVKGGYWRVHGVGEYSVADTTLTLTGSIAYIYVRKTLADATVEIGFANTRPSATDAVYYYIVLCKCDAFKPGHYSITEINYRGGDIIQSAPLG